MNDNASFIERQSADPDLDPYPNFRWLRENDPVSLVAEGEGSQTFLLTSFEQVRSCLLDPRLSGGAVERGVVADIRRERRRRKERQPIRIANDSRIRIRVGMTGRVCQADRGFGTPEIEEVFRVVGRDGVIGDGHVQLGEQPCTVQ